MVKSVIKNILIHLFPTIFIHRTFHKFQTTFDQNKVDQEFEIIPFLIDKQSVVLDIGANLGEYTYFFQEVIQAKEIFAFEPIPSLYKRLRLLFPKLKIYPYAISNQSSTSYFYIPYIDTEKFQTRAKLDLLPEKNETRVDKIQVETITLDTLFKASTDKIHFIKIDIEGHELQAIRGAEKIIKQDLPVLMIEIEFRHHPLDFYSVIEEICALGYRCTFYDKSLKSLLDIQLFSLEKHQNLTLTENYYVHNFLFFPMDYSVDLLNNTLKSSL